MDQDTIATIVGIAVLVILIACMALVWINHKRRD